MKKQIIIGCDHGGFYLKELLKATLEEQSYEVCDVGCYDLK
ncbi:RpiB/LacA/LacB family sugar-phosphate isomerase, partial [bacterium]|nr:RpiB/LacA/LacB family sugar-phosphate isomerase [bacterium]